MFWLHHPQPVRPRKAVAELTVARHSASPMSTSVIIVDAAPGRRHTPSVLIDDAAARDARLDPQG